MRSPAFEIDPQMRHHHRSQQHHNWPRMFTDRSARRKLTSPERSHRIVGLGLGFWKAVTDRCSVAGVLMPGKPIGK